MPKLILTRYEKHVLHWKNCQRCPLHENRRNVVMYKGKLPCDILFVGEAPGVVEDRFGTPFEGPAGHLLDSIIESSTYGITVCRRCNTFIGEEPCSCENGKYYQIAKGFTNVIGCIPLEDGLKVSTPPTESIKACGPRLEEIVELALPKAIITVGAVAEKVVKTKFETPRISITHPAAILRSSEAQKEFTIQKVVAQLSTFIRELT